MAITLLQPFNLDTTKDYTFANITGTANISSGNADLGNLAVANYFSGDGGYLSNLQISSATVANANFANYAGQVVDSAQSNITSVGTLVTLSVSGNITTGNASLGNLATANYFSGNGSLLSHITGANVSGTVGSATVASSANSVTGSNVSGQVGNALVAGTVYTNAQPNITSVGTLSSLSVTANISSGNANLGNLAVANYFSGDGGYLSNLQISSATVANANYANYAGTVVNAVQSNITTVGTLSSLTATGNVTGGNIVTSNRVSAANVYVTSLSSQQIAIAYTGGQLVGGPDLLWDFANASLFTTGLTSNGNITISGDINAGNVTGGNLVTANYFSGDGGYLSNLQISSATVANANHANYAGQVLDGSQPNITSLGTLSDTTIAGNLTVTGTTIYANVSTLNVKDPIIEMGGNPNGTPLSTNDGKDRGTLLHYFNGAAIDAFMGWDASNSEFGFGSNVTNSSEVITFNTYGNLRAGYFIGNGSQLTGVVANANYTAYAGNVTIGSQPNITSVGTLSSLTVTANISSGNANLGNLGYATYLGGTLTTAAQPNITSVGTLASLGVTGNVEADYYNINGGIIFTSTEPSEPGETAYIQYTLLSSEMSVLELGINDLGENYYIKLNANGGTVITGTVSSDDANLGNLATANYFSGNGSLLTSITGGNVTGQVANALVAGTVYTNAQPNITSVGTLSSLSVTANVTAGNIKSDHLLYANGTPYAFTTNAAGTNTQVQFNDGNSFAGNAGLTFDKTTTTLTANNFVATTSASLGAVGNVTITGGSTGYVLTTDGSGHLSWQAAGGTTIGFTNVAKDDFTGNGVQTTFLLSKTPSGAAAVQVSIDGLVQQSGAFSISGSNVVFSPAPASGAAIEVTTYGVTTLTGTNTQVLFNDAGDVGASTGFTFNKSSNALTVTGNLTSANANLGNVATANYFSGNGSLLTSIAGANVTGTVSSASSATTAGTVTTNAQPNITSTGTLNGLAAGGTVNFTTASNVSLGSNSNVHITGGSSGQYLYTDGSGGLSWGTVSSTGVSNGNSNVNIPSANGNVNISSAGNANIVVVTGTGVNVAGTLNTGSGVITTTGNVTAGNANLGNVVTANYTNAVLTTGAQPNITSTGTLTSLSVTGNISSGNANLGNLVTANYFTGNGSLLTSLTGGNVTGQVANALVAGTVYTNAQPNITSTGTLNGLTATSTINFTSASNVSLGSNSNVHITGGSSGQYLQTDGSGGLSWVTLSVSTASISNGNSNVNIPSANGNVTISSAGNANVVVVTGTGINVAGNITAGTGTGGNITGANLVSANYFSGDGSLLTSITGANVTGTVSSATSATTAGTVTTNAQPNITSLGTIAGLTGTGTFNLTGTSNTALGAVGNVHITGGSSGQYLQTDGSGGLSWVSPSVGTSIVNGTSNVNIPSSGGNVTVSSAGNANIIVVTGTGVNVAGTLNTGSGVITTTGNVSAGNANLGNLVTANYFSGSGNLLSNIQGANVTGAVSSATTAATVTTNAQPNITSTGTLSSLTVTGLITATSTGVKTSNIVDSSGTTTIVTGYGSTTGAVGIYGTLTVGTSGAGNITAYNANLGNVVTANYTNAVLTTGAQPNITSTGTLTGLTSGGVVNFTTSSNVSLGAVGNVHITGGSSGQYLQTDGSGTLSWVSPSVGTSIVNGTSNVAIPSSGGNVTVGVGGNADIVTVTGTGVNVAGTLNTGSGVITTTGNVTAGNANLGNLVTANYISGNGSLLSAITGSNVTGTVANATYAVSAGLAGTVTTNAQPNITSVGTLTDTTIAGNLTVTGTTIYANVSTLNVKDPVIEMGGNPNGTPLSTNDGKDRGTLLHYYVTANTTAVNAFMGWDESNAEFGFGSNVTNSSEVMTFNNYGNVRAAYFLGNGSQLTGVIGNANYAAYAGVVTTNAQPNITSIGTLTSLTVSGNVSSGNANLGNLAVANYFSGDGGYLSNLQISSATVANANYANYAGNVINAAQSNITSLGTLTSLTVSGNITTGNASLGNLATSNYFSGNGALLTSITGANVTGTVSSATTAGTVTTNAQPNITSVGTLSSLTVTANISSGNANLGNLATASYFSGNGSLITYIAGGNVSGQVGNALVAGTVYTNAQPNITSLGTIAGLTGTGTFNLTGTSNVALGAIGNVHITGGSTGQYLQTDGSGGLSWVTPAAGASISNGTSNVNIPSTNGNVTVGVAGTSNVVVVTGTGVNVAGTLNTGAGNITSGNANLGNAVVANYFVGDGGYLSNVQVSAGTSIVNGTSNVAVGLNGNATIGIAGTANVVIVTSTGVNVAGTLNTGSGVITTTGNITAGNANLGNLVTANYFSGDGSLLSAIAGGNVTGTVSSASSATTAGTVTTNAQPNITSVGTLASLTVTANISSGNATLGNLATANFFSGNGSLITYITGANVSGAVASATSATTAGTVTTNAQPNITSVGTLASLSVSGNLTLSGNVVGAFANGNSNVNIPSSNGNVTISSAGNANIIVVTGTGVNVAGTLNTGSGVITTTGNVSAGNANLGNLATANYFSGNGSLITYITGANVSGAVGSATTAGTVTTNAQPNITSLGIISSLSVTGLLTATGTGVKTSNIIDASGTTSIVTGYNTTTGDVGIYGTLTVGTSGSGNITAYNANLGNLVTSNYFSGNGSLLSAITGANVTGTVASATSAGSATTAGTVTTNAQPNITSVGTLAGVTATGTVNFTGTSNVSLGAVGNLHISGGTSGYVLSTDGSGSLSWVAQTGGGGGGSSISNGTSNVNIATADGNVTVGVAGNADIATFTGTGVNVTGTLGVSSTVTASRFISNIATGTAPLTVSSTTRVSNLNVAYANVSDYGAVTAQTTGTFYPVFVSGSSSGNYALGANSSISLDVANSALTLGSGTGGSIIGANVISANYFSGNGTLITYIAGGNVSGQVANALVASTVYTNAQPNITSVGSLSGVTLVSNGNITMSGAGSQLTGANIISANYFTGTLTTGAQGNITSLGTLTALSVSGNLTLSGNVVGPFANGTSNVNIPAANGNVNISAAGNANIITVTGTGVNVAGTLNTGSGVITTTGNITAGNANLGNLVTANYTNAVLTTGAQPNITSHGSLTGLTVSNASGVVNFVTTANVSLGSVSNLHISGGTSGYFLSTDGSGTLSWASGSGAAIADDTTTNATYYPIFATASSGTLSTATVSTTKLTYNPSTGTLTAQDLNTLSDMALKDNPEQIQNPMEILMQLFGMGFNWKNTKKKSYGLMAQMVEKVLPELVNTTPEGVKTVNYIPIIAFLIEAIKKQQEDIDSLKKDK